MGLDKDDLDTLIEMLDAAETFRPLVEKFDKVVENFGPDIKKTLMRISMGRADIHIALFKKLIGAGGFTRAEAMLLLLDEKIAITKTVKNLRKSKGEES